jgi:hypothetical protein
MTTASDLNHFKTQALLEQKFQECLDLVGGLQEQVKDSLPGESGFQTPWRDYVLNRFREFCPKLYRLIGDTLFQLLQLLQPGDCQREERINFYYWPGYHSYLADRRIFIRKERWNVGVGICGVPDGSDIEYYDDCSQARWYHYLIPPLNRSGITPIDVHRWLRKERPRCPTDPHKLISSLTVTTRWPDPDEQGLFQEHRVLPLTADAQGTETWGRQFDGFINLLGGETKPDRELNGGRSERDEEQAQSRGSRVDTVAVQSKLHSVWLHTAFCQSEPPWLKEFIEELLPEQRTRPAAAALRNGLADEVAKDWGDASLDRPRFSSWSYLSLHAWLAPSLAPIFDAPSSVAQTGRKTEASSTVGSAEFLSSVPLRPLYYGYVRPWLSSVYGALRNAEISILLHRQQRDFRTAVLPGPYFAHELKKLIDEGSASLLRDADKTDREAVRTRQFVLYSLCTLSNLAYAFTNAVLSRDLKAIEREKKEFLEPLRALHANGQLLAVLQHVAEQVYESVWHEQCARVVFPKCRGDRHKMLPELQHRSCFLLVAEMIRSYCEYEKDCEAVWNATVENDSLVISLTGPTRAQRNPASMTDARLHVFLKALDIGEASVAWHRERKECVYTVKVNNLRGDTGAATIEGRSD